MTFHRLHHDYGIVHNQADGKYQTKQREGINRKTKQREEDKRAYQGDRYRQERDQGSSPSLKEEIDDENHQRDGNHQGKDDFPYSLDDGTGGVERHRIVHISRKASLQFRHQFLHARCGIHGIGSRQLIDGDYSARLSVQAPRYRIVLRSELDTGDVFHAHHAAIRRLANHNLPEFFWRDQSSLRANCVGELLSGGDRFSAHFSGWVHCILRLDCVDDLRDGDCQFGELIWLDPEPHGVLACSEYLDLTNAGGAGDGIDQVDIRVIGKELRVVAAVRRVHRDQHERGGNRLSYRNSIIRNVGGKLRCGLRLSGLGENQIVIGIGFYIEVHNQKRLRVSGCVQRIHVVHVVHSAHLLFDRSGNRLFES